MLVAMRTHDYGKQPVDHLAKLLRSESIEAKTACGRQKHFRRSILMRK